MNGYKWRMRLTKSFYNRRNFVKTAAKGAIAMTVAVSGFPNILSGSEFKKNAASDRSSTGQKLNDLDQYNIVWNTQSENSSESMPVGGGDIGCNIWVENGDILFYMQRSGSLDENGEYLKLGRVRIKLTPNPFESPSSFRQELKLKEGFVEVETSKSAGTDAFYAKIRVWVDVMRSVIHVEMNSNKSVEVIAAYESWRFQDKELCEEGGRDRWGCFSLEGYPGKVIKRKDEIDHTTQGVLFYHRNSDSKLIPDILIKQQALEAYANEIVDDLKDRTFGGILLGKGFVSAGIGEGKYLATPFRSWMIKSKKAEKYHHLLVISQIEQAKTFKDWKKELNVLTNQALKDKKAFKNTVDWWNQYWERSRIVIFPGHSEPSDPVWQMGRNYQLFRYQLGCNVGGEYPSKFNGGNFTFDPVLINEKYSYDPDWRAWGGDVFTAQNQRLIHWPMLKSGDFDLILPQFELYRKGLPGATARVKTHFGHKGSVFCEYMNVPGVAFGAGWGWSNGKHRKRGEEIPFGDPRVNGLAGYDTLAEKGVMANPSVSYHWESQVEHAYMILEYHRFTGSDISQYMPFIKSALIFFDEHYQLRQKMRNGKMLDMDGKLVLYPSTSCESYRGAKNPSDLIAGLRACLKSLMLLDEKYVSVSEKGYYNKFLNRIPDYPFDKAGDIPILKPAHEWIQESNQELPQFYPLFPFNEFKIGDNEIQTFKNTYRIAPDFRKGTVVSWHQDGIFFARMGMTKEAAAYNTKKLQDSNRRFPTFWGPGHDWVPDHNWGGSGMIGLQEMLVQTVDDKILLLPAWPKDWDVSFKLHVPRHTTVEVEFVKGEFKKINVFPVAREKDLVLPQNQ